MLHLCALYQEGSRGAFREDFLLHGPGGRSARTQCGLGIRAPSSVWPGSRTCLLVCSLSERCLLCGYRPCWGHIPGAVHHHLGFQRGSQGGRHVQIDEGCGFRLPHPVIRGHSLPHFSITLSQTLIAAQVFSVPWPSRVVTMPHGRTKGPVLVPK